MSIQATDLEFRFSAPDASAGDQFDQDTPGLSLGRYVSTTVWAGGVLHDLFAAVSGADNLAGKIEYRCLFIVNKHATLTWTGPVIWFSTDTQAGSAEIAMGLDPTGASALTSTAEQARAVANATSAPAGVGFSKPLSQGAGLVLGDIPPGYCKAFWLRRTAQNSLALAGESCTISASGNTL